SILFTPEPAGAKWVTSRPREDISKVLITELRWAVVSENGGCHSCNSRMMKFRVQYNGRSSTESRPPVVLPWELAHKSVPACCAAAVAARRLAARPRLVLKAVAAVELSIEGLVRCNLSISVPS